MPGTPDDKPPRNQSLGQIYDVLIVGAGPAGSSAAYDLAEAGLKTALIEKARFPRYKVCGGGLTQRTLKRLRFPVGSVIEQSSNKFELHFLQSGMEFCAEDSQPVVSMAMRARFDALLVEKAVEKGVEFHDGRAVLDLVQHPAHLAAATDKGDIRARFVVAADGANGIAARKSGFEDDRLLIPAVEHEMRVGRDVLDRFKYASRIDFETVSRGYSWVFGKADHLSVGVGRFRRESADLNRAVREYVENLGIRPEDILSVEKHGFLIPVRPRAGKLRRDRVFLVGDAAGLADPLTAEGIYFAVASGQIAARAIIAGCGAYSPQDARAAELAGSTFEKEIREELLDELQAGRAIAEAFYGHPRIVRLLFRWKGQRLTRSMLQLTQGRKSYQEALRKPGRSAVLALANFTGWRAEA